MPTQTTNQVKLLTLLRALIRVTSRLFVVVLFVASFVTATTQAHGQERPVANDSGPIPAVRRQQFDEQIRRIRNSGANSESSHSDDAEPVTSRESKPVRTASNSRKATAIDGESRIQRVVYQPDAASALSADTAESQVSPLRSTPNETPNETRKPPSPTGGIDSNENKPPELFLDLTKEQAATATGEPEKPRAEESATLAGSASPVHILTRAIAWIVVALCLLSLTVLGVRRWQRQRGLLPTTNARSRVLETLSLGPGRTVSLIEIAGFRALVAADVGGIRSLVLTPTSFQDEFAMADKELNHDPVSVTDLETKIS